MLDRMRAKFPTAAIAVVEFAGNWDQLGPGTARLTSFVTPRDLQHLQSLTVIRHDHLRIEAITAYLPAPLCGCRDWVGSVFWVSSIATPSMITRVDRAISAANQSRRPPTLTCEQRPSRP